MTILHTTVLKSRLDDYGFHKIASMLRKSEKPDRRLDSIVTVLALGPAGACLDEEGFDGWDILAPACDNPEIWMEAADVLYVTRYADAALELCQSALGADAAAAIVSALCAVTRRRLDPKGDISGVIARHVAAETLEWIERR